MPITIYDNITDRHFSFPVIGTYFRLLCTHARRGMDSANMEMGEPFSRVCEKRENDGTVRSRSKESSKPTVELFTESH